MFRVKICGVTRAADVAAIAEAGADAIGLNFYINSPRHVSPEGARQISGNSPPELTRVGVFVNASAGEIETAIAAADLAWVQLHGDEPPAVVAALPNNVRVLRALRLGPEGLGPVAVYVQACRLLGRAPDAVLIDSASPGAYGGTGQTADWGALAGWRNVLGETPLVLAGGLNPGNVGRAIEAVAPTAVDVASGVETSPGVKSPELVSRFATEANLALNRLPHPRPRMCPADPPADPARGC